MLITITMVIIIIITIVTANITISIIMAINMSKISRRMSTLKILMKKKKPLQYKKLNQRLLLGKELHQDLGRKKIIALKILMNKMRVNPQASM